LKSNSLLTALLETINSAPNAPSLDVLTATYLIEMMLGIARDPVCFSFRVRSMSLRVDARLVWTIINWMSLASVIKLMKKTVLHVLGLMPVVLVCFVTESWKTMFAKTPYVQQSIAQLAE
jgi:hypothetical protein